VDFVGKIIVIYVTLKLQTFYGEKYQIDKHLV